MLKIRGFEEKDAREFVEISNEAFQDEIARGMEKFTEKKFLELSKRREVKIFVAEKGRCVVGFLTLTEGNTEKPAQVHLVAVKKPLRRKGIGTKLMKNAVKHVKTVGRKKLKLFTRPWNTAMCKICIDLGFIPEAYLRKEFLDEDLILFSAFFE